MFHLLFRVIQWGLLLQEELPCNGVFIRVAMVWSFPSDELEQDAAYSPDVSFLSEFSVKQLRSHVSDGTTCI